MNQYIIFNQVTGSTYHYIADCVECQIKRDKCNLMLGRHKDVNLQREWKLYGADHFQFITENVTTYRG